jgi:multicomponent Na+:H+ antiporter subunit B
VLLTLLIVITISIVRMRNLFGVIVLAGVYSFLMASVLIVYDAVDVAMTEAAVGAGVSTVLLLSALHLTKAVEYPTARPALVPFAVAVVVGAALIWATYELPAFGVATAPIHQHVAPYYIENSVRDTTVINLVSAVLADYRSFDTLGEVTVVFTAGIGVMLLLKGRRAARADDKKASKSGGTT